VAQPFLAVLLGFLKIVDESPSQQNTDSQDLWHRHSACAPGFLNKVDESSSQQNAGSQKKSLA
jgi:hypothetical protein